MSNKITRTHSHHKSSYNEPHHYHGQSCNDGCSDKPEFIGIPGGFIHDDERFVLTVIKDGEEQSINKVIYDICKVLEEDKTHTHTNFPNTEFELDDDGILTITDAQGTLEVSFEDFLTRIAKNETDLQALTTRMSETEVKCQNLVAEIARINKCLEELENLDIG